MRTAYRRRKLFTTNTKGAKDECSRRRVHEERRVKQIVVAYYSRTGGTRKVAEQLAAILDADLEEIREAKDRSGVLGLLSAAMGLHAQTRSGPHQRAQRRGAQDRRHRDAHLGIQTAARRAELPQEGEPRRKESLRRQHLLWHSAATECSTPSPRWSPAASPRGWPSRDPPPSRTSPRLSKNGRNRSAGEGFGGAVLGIGVHAGNVPRCGAGHLAGGAAGVSSRSILTLSSNPRCE